MVLVGVAGVGQPAAREACKACLQLLKVNSTPYTWKPSIPEALKALNPKPLKGFPRWLPKPKSPWPTNQRKPSTLHRCVQGARFQVKATLNPNAARERPGV